VCWSGGTIVVRDEMVFGPAGDESTRRFLERSFRLAEVGSVSVDRTQGIAIVRPVETTSDSPRFLTKLAAALRSDDGPLPDLPRGVRETVFTVHRHGTLLSSCEIATDQPGLLRVRHERLRRDRVLARAIGDWITALTGVVRTSLASRSGTLTIRYKPGLLAAPRLIRLTEDALDSTGWWDRTVPPPPRTSFALVNSNLAVGAAADLAVSALAPASAVLLLGSNLRTFELAWSQLRQRKPGLPVLYTVIVGGTLASGQFLASALMSWSFKFWNDRLRQDLTAERRRLLAECLPLPRLARLTVPRGEVLAPADRLRPGDQVLLGPGDLVPADGRVTRGEGVVDEQALRGLEGASRRRSGDALLAGSTVLHGSLALEVARPVDRTRAWNIGQSLLSATSPAPGDSSPTRSTEAFAERAIVPTFAMAAVGLLAGGLATASAILRPDYATGPGVAVPLETVRDATACVRLGIVVRSADAFDQLARLDTVVLEDAPYLRACGLELAEVESRIPEPLLLRYAASAFRHMADDRSEALLDACRNRHCHILDLPAVEFDPGVTVVHGTHRVRVRDLDPDREGCGPLRVEIDGGVAGVLRFVRSARPKAAIAVDRVRRQAGAAFVLLSDRPESDAAELASRLEIADYQGGMSDQDKAGYLRDCRARGARAAFVGDCRSRGAVAAQALVAVSTSGETNGADDPAAVVLLRPRIDSFADLCEVARSHWLRVQAAQQLVIVPNALCVAGALFFGATALAVVVVSNLSTLGLYQRSSGFLHSPVVPTRGRPKRRLVASPVPC
jgi:Cu2+-exporting ATPase